MTREPEQHERADGPLQLAATPPAGKAISASGGPTSSAWHLVLAIGATTGVAARVLAELGLPYRAEAPPVEPASEAAGTWGNAIEEAASLAKAERGGVLDTGILLRAAVSVLLPKYVPGDQQQLLTSMQEADLAALCAQSWTEHGPEGDERAKEPREFSFAQYDESARGAVVGAREEARLLAHGYIGTEHLLLGVLREPQGVASRALLGIELEPMRLLVRTVVAEGSEPVTGHLPFTPRARDVLHLAWATARDLGHDGVAQHHLLIALADEGQGIAAQLLADAGLSAKVVRERVLAALADQPPEAAAD